MRISVSENSPVSSKNDTLVVLTDSDSIRSNATLKSLDKALGSAIRKSFDRTGYEGKEGELLKIDSLGNIGSAQIIIAGLGEKAKVTLESLRRTVAGAMKLARSEGAKSVALEMRSAKANRLDDSQRAQACVEGAILSLYRFEELKSEKSKKKIEKLSILKLGGSSAGITRGIRKGKILAEAVSLSRDLINLPGNFATPTYLATQAKNMCKKNGIKCTILGPKEIEAQKMGGVMAVARGSHEPAKFIIMNYQGGKKSDQPIVLVGKGVTFDTGGISIKPSANMEEMKMDMSGGAAVIGTMKAVAELKLAANVIGLVPAVENMPGGSAIKPGDVATGLSGVTMEIINTDAEGRLILADALAYADRFKPSCTIDLATLTGACMVALGAHAAGLFGNDEKLIEKIIAAGKASGETCWHMPLLPEYSDDIKSEVADIKNVGPRWGGASTAAAFLQKHVKGDWAHIDIAGVAYTGKAKHYLTSGGQGFGVRTLIRFIENL